jgi:hypothetical protein
MAEGMLFFQSAPDVAHTSNANNPPKVSENEIRKGLKHLVRSSLFNSFIYSVRASRKCCEIFRIMKWVQVFRMNLISSILIRTLQVILVNTIFIAMDDLWAEMDKDNNFVNKNSYNADWAILAVFT